MDMGLNGPNRCALCGENAKTTSHLFFFSCKFSRIIFRISKHGSNLCILLAVSSIFYGSVRDIFVRANGYVNSLDVLSLWLFTLSGWREIPMFENKFSTHMSLIWKIQFITSIRLLHTPNLDQIHLN